MYDNEIGLLKAFYIPKMPEKTSYEGLGEELLIPFECYLSVLEQYESLVGIGFETLSDLQVGEYMEQCLRAITIASQDTTKMTVRLGHPSEEFFHELQDFLIKSTTACEIKVNRFLMRRMTRVIEFTDFTSEVLGQICLYCHISAFYAAKANKTPSQVETMSKRLLDFMRAHAVHKTLFMQLNTSEYLQ